jgi:L-asparagine transporter-like permease
MIATYFACAQTLISLSQVHKAPALLKIETKKGFFKFTWLAVGISTLLIVLLSFALGSKLFNYLISASSYFSFFNWVINLITYLIWLKHRDKNESYDSPLILGRKGAYSTLFIIIALFIISLGVAEFRTGLYAAAGILIIISISYKILTLRK